MEQLEDAFRAFLVEVCGEIARDEIPFKVWFRLVKRDGEDGWSYITEFRPDITRMLNTLRIGQVGASESAENLYCVIQSNPPLIFNPNAGYQSDPLWRLDAASDALNKIARPFLDAYFRHANGLEFDEESFKFVFDQLASDWRTDSVRVVERTPLLNVTLGVDFPVILGELSRIVKADFEDIERWVNPSAMTPALRSPLSEFSIGMFDAVLETSAVWFPTVNIGSTKLRDERESVLRLMRLAFDSRIVSPLVERQSSMKIIRPFLESTLLSSQREPEIIEKFVLGPQNVERVRQIYSAFHSSGNKKELDIALRRWSDSMDRVRRDDELVDLWIGLESLFLRMEDELSLRVSLRVAILLEQDNLRRKEIFNNTRISYSWRSAIVHASESSRRSAERKRDMRSTCQITHDYLRRALLHIVNLHSWEPKKIDEDLFR